MYNIFYKSLTKLDSVLLVYLDKDMGRNKIELVSEDCLLWLIPTYQDSVLSSVKYYSFIINNQFCVCDPNCYRIHVIDEMNFSYIEDLLTKRLNNVGVINSSTGKDLENKTFEVVNKTEIFSNLDSAICYTANLKNVTEDSTVIFQIINPKGELHFVDCEYLMRNKKNGERIYYAGLKITPKLLEGIWTFQLIHQNKIIDAKAVLYKIYKIDYGKDKNSHFTKKSFNFNLEI
ncbi:hypothetical protein [Lysinibacillus sphaericus]|uniref:hypothetical protein n=1 Tax=Lysinibacillus sphaericus TaxID=1421 RepID=UPI0019102EBD|nr:hypothetical protein [Lysinibacillus sphaericus]QPA56329.1 hypothetical protein INQ53_10245 [Lysinibacillus sphaericus]